MTDRKKLKLFVIVVTYNGMKWIDRCLSSVVNSTMAATLIVVDNDSKDGTPQHVIDAFPGIVLLRNTVNEFFGRANNRAIRYALDHGADYIYLLNQDAWVMADTLSTLVEIMERHEEYGIASPMQMAADENIYLQIWQRTLTIEILRCL